MSPKVVRFLSLMFTALALSAGVAHLSALPNKINLPADEYLLVQQIYRGWALFGIAMAGALISTLVLTIMARHKTKSFALSLTSLLCVVGSLIVFFVFTFPVNLQTENWTVLPENWPALRAQWEYSHAVGAVLYLVALIALILAALEVDQRPSGGEPAHSPA